MTMPLTFGDPVYLGRDRMDNFLSLTGRPPLGGDGGVVLVRLDALGDLVTFLHGAIDRLRAMRGAAEAAAPSRNGKPRTDGGYRRGAVANALAGGQTSGGP